MAQRIYRVCRSAYSRLDGEGAKRGGGRWNSVGKSVVYMAETVSLAVLENLVHMTREDFPVGYVMLAAVIPQKVRVHRDTRLPGEFDAREQVKFGDQWLESRDSAVLAVRSAVVPFEYNYLLNPAHPDFGAIRAEPVVPFIFDERLFGHR
jgi:RES domain-containing protein